MSKAEEFNEVKLHRHDKLMLNKLNQHADIKFRLSGKVKDTEGKVFIMIQSALGNIHLEDVQNRFQVNVESKIILQHGHRIIKCFIELAAYKENVKLLRVAIDLARCIKAKMWDDSPLLLRQLDGIGEQYAKKLADVGISTFEQLKESDTWRIEMNTLIKVNSQKILSDDEMLEEIQDVSIENEEKRKNSASPKPPYDRQFTPDEPLLKTRRIRNAGTATICSGFDRLIPEEVEDLSDFLSDDDKLIDPQELERLLLSTAAEGASNGKKEKSVENDLPETTEETGKPFERISPFYEENEWHDWWDVDELEVRENQVINTTEEIDQNQQPRFKEIPRLTDEPMVTDDEGEVFDSVKDLETDQLAIEESGGLNDESMDSNTGLEKQRLPTEDGTRFKTFTEALVILDCVLQKITM
ncbi:5229_t:CDS:2 [Acaulospora colombiana]|uniref:5229_t:CDS:1 n=1 Tax=Acaulospora colombiana TaxID=27376 RepID=A0ACA9K3Z6_9GLOM|nr:5229_t:CDS:2 [Acaulospora colombiana]